MGKVEKKGRGNFGKQWRWQHVQRIENFLDFLRQVVSEGFVKLHSELNELRFEFKTEINAVKLSIKDREKPDLH